MGKFNFTHSVWKQLRPDTSHTFNLLFETDKRSTYKQQILQPNQDIY